MAGSGQISKPRKATGKSRLDRNRKVLCGCGCNMKLSTAQSGRHMRGLAPHFIAVSSARRRAVDLSYIQNGSLVPDVPTAPAFLSDANILLDGERNEISDGDMDIDDNLTGCGLDDQQDIEGGMADQADSEPREVQTGASIALSFSAMGRRVFHLEDEDALSDNSLETNSDAENDAVEEDDDEEEEEDIWIRDTLGADALGWTLADADLMDNGRDLTAEELLGEDFEREAANNENRITEADLRFIRAFQYKHTYFLSESAFKALPYAFPHTHIPSIDRMRSRIRALSGLSTKLYDCCVNSCCCFTGCYEGDISCRFCDEFRYAADGKTARKNYSYSPIIPRLRGMFENKALCRELLYRHEYQTVDTYDHNDHRRDPSATAMTDIFDGKVYNDLRKRRIKVNGEELHAKYFSDPHDIALGLSTDGFAPWRKRKYTAWPLLLFNYNLPPEKRFHRKHIIAVSIIPGPKKPKDVDSFLFPLIEELLNLSNGVRAFDANTGMLFCLRAFLIIAFGDIPAISLLLKVKGHNSMVPCRSCNIHGVQLPGENNPNKMYYVPLDRSSHPKAGNILKYDPKNLPMRTHEEFLINAELVIAARTRAEEETLAKDCGIKGKTILTALDSFSIPNSVPYDFMHLIYENLLKNLILLWTNDFKGLSVGTGSYIISATVWDAIGVATAKASDTIPSVYSARLRSISGDRSTFTADNYSFWALFIGPILLQRRFNQSRYYEHFVQLVCLLHICLKYEYTVADMKAIRDGFVAWVTTYENLYYQHSPVRLPTCTLTIHALLHIADGIEACGPVWAYWAFPMERYCGLLQRAVLNSRRHPYITLDKFVAEDAMLVQLKMRYNLFADLSLKPQNIENYGHSVSSYSTCVLLLPHSIERLPSNVTDRISAALATRYNVHKTVAKRHVPQQIDQWGRVRRTDLGGGDTMRAALLGKAYSDRRDRTHIRYQTLVDVNARRRRQLPSFENRSFYGQLLRIFCFTVAASPQLGLLQPETIIFAEIQPCNILSKHTALDIHYYKAYKTPLVFDIKCVQCLVGRVKLENDSGGSEWAVFDRSGTLAQATYTEEGPEDSI